MNMYSSEDHSKLYAKYRPTYPRAVFDTIIDFCKETQPAQLCTAIDVGCGTGQSSFPLAKHFGKVIGLDISSSQISQAKETYPDLDFRVGSAEDLSFIDNSSVDLVTVAQALHWMDRNKVFEEIKRVLKPGGSFVAYGYGLTTCEDEEVEQHVLKFGKEVLVDYWESGAEHVDNKYKDVNLPFPGWKRNDTLEMRREWTIDDVLGFVSSWAAWHKLLKLYPDSPELDTLAQKLKDIFPRSSDTVTMRWPIFMLMGHKT